MSGGKISGADLFSEQLLPIAREHDARKIRRQSAPDLFQFGRGGNVAAGEIVNDFPLRAVVLETEIEDQVREGIDPLAALVNRGGVQVGVSAGRSAQRFIACFPARL